MSRKYRNIAYFASIVLIIILSLSACIVAPPNTETEKALEKTWQEMISNLKDSANQWIQEYIESLVSDQIDRAEEVFNHAKDQVTNMVESNISRFKEYFGLDASPDVGAVTLSITTLTSRSAIKEEFVRLYKEVGGGRKIGYADDVVTYWKDSGEVLLVQYFTGGSIERSAIVMADGEETAYLLPGEWLTFYENLGGPNIAGVPISSPTTWNTHSPVKLWIRYGRGERQLFWVNNHEYAVLKRNGSDDLNLVPIFLWNFYRQEKNYSLLGYPLSSYPLDDKKWQADPRISKETKAILTHWQDSPFRVQLFENGAVLFKSDHAKMEMIEASNLFGIGGLSNARFLDKFGNILITAYITANNNSQWNNATDPCFLPTLQHAGVMAQSEFLQVLFTEIKKQQAHAALSGSSVLAESVYSTLMLMSAETIVNQFGETQWSEAVTDVVIGQTIDSIYAKGIGEVLSKPASKITSTLLELGLNDINKNRYSVQLLTRPDLPVHLPQTTFSTLSKTTMTVRLSVVYDPLTNFVSGTITSDGEKCNADGYGFYFKFETGDTSSYGGVATTGDVWDGNIHFFDLNTGKEISP